MVKLTSIKNHVFESLQKRKTMLSIFQIKKSDNILQKTIKEKEEEIKHTSIKSFGVVRKGRTHMYERVLFEKAISQYLSEVKFRIEF